MIGKFVVVTGSTPNAPWSDICALAHANHQAWSTKHGGVAVQYDLTDHLNGRPASWAKLKCLQIAAEWKVPVIWMDADCIFSDTAKLEDFMPYSNQIRTVLDVNWINCGTMSFPAEDWVIPFITSWYDNAPAEHINCGWWEQQTLHSLMRQPQHAYRLGPAIPLTSVRHAAGVPTSRKLDWLNKVPGSGMRVQKILHQIWLDPVEPIPEKFMAYRETWLKNHPNWQHKLWTAKNVSSLFPLICQRAFDLIPHNVFKSDLLRLELIHRFGGVYVDLDFECARNIEPAIEDITEFAAFQSPGLLCTSFLGGMQNSQIYRKMLASMALNVTMLLQARRLTKVRDYLNVTGPQAFTRFVSRDPHFTGLDTELFYPYHWTEAGKFKGFEAYPKAYAAHHWAGTWTK